ncbi:MAG: DUF2071 domain-containing protein [Deinococcota bacterium]
MRLPAMSGVIDRRILANYRVDPDYMANVLPPPFRPQVYDGVSIGGICLIRLTHVRPKMLPGNWGIRSENAAHRFAVEWDSETGIRQGVYIPRRDTNSRLNAWAGGRIFPGVHHHASFTVDESATNLSVSMKSEDGNADVYVSGQLADHLPDDSVFDSLSSASLFFEKDDLGYSDTQTAGRFDGLKLQCQDWKVYPLDVVSVHSNYFDNTSIFPLGTATFDNALFMRDITHEWHGQPDLCCAVDKA